VELLSNYTQHSALEQLIRQLGKKFSHLLWNLKLYLHLNIPSLMTVARQMNTFRALTCILFKIHYYEHLSVYTQVFPLAIFISGLPSKIMCTYILHT